MSDFHDAIYHAVGKDPRYHPHAYEFVRDALHTAVKHFRSGQEDQHVSGQEVLEGVRLHALDEYGPMAFTILSQWGLHQGEDVGNVVYNLIESGYFGRNEGDSLEDFSGGYAFSEAFAKPFEPRSRGSLQS
ncbi:MAG: Minf_1886 family protein [Prosthecobacter sp.]|nr:Minf_1886 family protein [Prosthecobacter sp.]